MMPSLGHRVATTGISPDRISQLKMERNGDILDANDPNETESEPEDIAQESDPNER